MANYGYIYRRKRIDPLLFEAELCRLAMPGWSVKKVDWRDGGPTWLVFIPGTALPYPACNERCQGPDDDCGFAVALQDNRNTIAFRHGPNGFERWAQGCMEESLSDALRTGVTYDATDETYPPGTRRYRAGPTYWDYITRNLQKPLSDSEREYLQRFAYAVPPGFDQGFRE